MALPLWPMKCANVLKKTMNATKEVEDAVLAIQEATRRNVETVDDAARLTGKCTGSATCAGESLMGIAHTGVGRIARTKAGDARQQQRGRQFALPSPLRAKGDACLRLWWPSPRCRRGKQRN